MQIDMSKFLDQTSSCLCNELESLLPAVSDSWWNECVKGKLSFQQRQHVDRRNVTRLDQLDLAALLRIVDGNWYELANHCNWPYEARNFVKEMQTVRNRWAHAQVAPPPQEDVYRDLDTLQRFLSFLSPRNQLIKVLQDQKKALLAYSEPLPQPQSITTKLDPPQSAFNVGAIVSLKADPTKSGAVTAVIAGDKENRYQVFHDGKVASYYESQLLLLPNEEPSGPNVLPLEAFHARITALQLLHPSISTLYSLHAARIDFIPYQFRPVLKFIQSDRPRLLIADSVGIGKTIEAGLILREMQARRDIRRVLIVCPRPLVTEEKWRLEMKRFDERFEHLDGDRLRFCISETNLDGEWPERYEKVILPFSLLSEELLYGSKRQKGLLQLDPPPQFDLVIVDEAHHIRNTNTLRHRAIRFLCDNAEAVIFLTATPIQLSDHDLFVLLNTLRPDVIIDEATYTTITEPNPHINEAAQTARQGQDGWPEEAKLSLDAAAATSWGQTVLQQDPQFQAVYDSLDGADQDRSTRIETLYNIERLHTLDTLMSRTLRRDIGDFTQRKPETVSIDFGDEQKQLHDEILATQAAIYSSLHGERSVNFLLTTIRRQAASCLYGLAPLLRGILSRRLDELEWDEIAELSDESVDPYVASENIRDMIASVLASVERLDVKPEGDPKFQALLSIFDRKQAMPNNKVMLFSSFRHTLGYLETGLKAAGYRVGLVHGGVKDEERVALKARFEMNRDNSEALDILLFSEVGCEGLDYQFCDCLVNYDLPWNPMRIDQRIGRIDRWGQQSEAVAIYNLITPGTVDADIYERCLIRIGVFERALGANEAILGKITRQITSVAENLSLSKSERQAKLDQLADNSIRFIREQQDLEARQTELFGLRVPADRFKEDVQNASSYWLSAEALERLASYYLQRVAGTEIPPLMGDGPRKLLRLSRTAREALLADFRKLPNRTTPVAREWESWLKGNEPHLVITFNASYSSDDRQACFVTPVHPLAIQAARATAPQQDLPVTGLEITTNAVPPGDYPFGIYQWQYHGIRSDVEFQPVTAEPKLTAEFFKLIPTAVEIPLEKQPIGKNTLKQLESQHYRLWSDARAEHIEKVARVADFRRGSLETSHKARLAVLDSQLERADNDRISIMKKAQKENAHADYKRHLREIHDAVSKADITAEPVGWGVIRVRG